MSALLSRKGTQAKASLELCELPTQGERVGEQGLPCPVYSKLAKKLTWHLCAANKGYPSAKPDS